MATEDSYVNQLRLLSTIKTQLNSLTIKINDSSEKYALQIQSGLAGGFMGEYADVRQEQYLVFYEKITNLLENIATTCRIIDQDEVNVQELLDDARRPPTY